MMKHHDLPYQPYYCEENIWHLCRHALFQGKNKRVVLLTNPQRAFALFFSRAASQTQAPVIWDYHVVLAVYDQGWFIWDPDTRLPIPCPAKDYLTLSFPGLKPEYTPQCRVINGDDYIAQFSSDRQHMLKSDGSWQAPLPPWPAIKQGPNTLMGLIDLDQRQHGQIMTLEETRTYFQSEP